MSEQPPVQPPRQPPNQPAAGNPPTQPMPAAPVPPPFEANASPASAYPPKATVWHQATSTSGRRWALALSAGAMALLLILGIGIAGLLVLRNHDRVGLFGNREDSQFLSQDGPGNGRGNGNGNGNGNEDGRGNGRGNGNEDGNGNDRGPGAKHDKIRPNQPGMPGMPGGRAHGLGGLGNLLGATSLHGEVTATVNGSVQALVFQRGEATAVSKTSITLKSTDGFVGTYGRDTATSLRGADLVKGGQVFVLARASDKVAITTMALPAEADLDPTR